MKKQVNHHEASHSNHPDRKRASLAPDVHSCGQSQCPHLYARPGLAQSRRRLERPADLRRLRHQPQHLHPCARDVPGRRAGGRAPRQATPAPQPRLDGWTGSPSHRHCVQSRSNWPRPLDRSLVGWKSGRTGQRPRRSRQKPSASCSKKRTQALATRAVVHPSRRSGVRRGHGGCAGPRRRGGRPSLPQSLL